MHPIKPISCAADESIQKIFCAVAELDDRFMQFHFSASKIVSNHD